MRTQYFTFGEIICLSKTKFTSGPIRVKPF